MVIKQGFGASFPKFSWVSFAILLTGAWTLNSVSAQTDASKLPPPKGAASFNLSGDWILYGIDVSANRWFADIQISQDPDNNLAGDFEWDIEGSHTYYGRERFEGTYSVPNRRFNVQGFALENNYLITTANYFAILNRTGLQMLLGNWSGPAVVPSNDWQAVKAKAVEHRFDTDTEGLTLLTDTPNSPTLTFSSEIGDPNGSILLENPVGGISTLLGFEPKPEFLGDWSWEGDISTVLSFESRGESISGGIGSGLSIEISNASTSATYTILPAQLYFGTEAFRTHIVPLKEEFWTVHEGDFNLLLQDVQSFRFLIHDINQGSESWRFDNIRLLIPMEPVELFPENASTTWENYQ